VYHSRVSFVHFVIIGGFTALLHFEDFGVTNAERLLELYRDHHSCFNDDMLVPFPTLGHTIGKLISLKCSQGTGAVTLAAVMAAISVTKTKLSDQRIIVYGAGSAGLGITRQLRDGMVTTDSISPIIASKKFYLIDKFGLIKQSLGPSKIRQDLSDFVRPDDEWDAVPTNDKGEVTLLEVVKKVKPTVLIGCSTHAGGFTKEVVQAMAETCDRPIILPLSNPSRLVEVDPMDANEWTGGRALLATGSPFPPAKMPNGKDYM
jgi:malate dehydrogenase (oxaloacetate-decarboxylating)